MISAKAFDLLYAQINTQMTCQNLDEVFIKKYKISKKLEILMKNKCEKVKLNYIRGLMSVCAHVGRWAHARFLVTKVSQVPLLDKNV